MKKRGALFLLVAIAGLTLALALPASAQPGPSQSPSPSTTASAAAPGHVSTKIGPPILGAGNWTKYIAVLIGGLGAVVVLALGAGYILQAPGFRRAEGDDSE